MDLVNLWGLIPVAFIIYQWLSSIRQRGVDSTSIDSEQNNRITKIEVDLENQKERLKELDSKTAREMAKLEVKIDQVISILMDKLNAQGAPVTP